MEDSVKLQMIKNLLGITHSDEDTILQTYLTMAEKEIITWYYGANTDVTTVPSKFEMIQVQAVVIGFNLNGAEGQTTHTENGIGRAFKYADMIEYIHAHVPSFAIVG